MGLSFSNFQKEKLAILALLVVGLFLAIYTSLYFSDAHESAEVYLRGSGHRIEEVGIAQKVWLFPFPSRIRTNGLDGSAELRFLVHGSVGNAIVTVSLQEQAGQWQVVQAKSQ